MVSLKSQKWKSRVKGPFQSHLTSSLTLLDCFSCSSLWGWKKGQWCLLYNRCWAITYQQRRPVIERSHCIGIQGCWQVRPILQVITTLLLTAHDFLGLLTLLFTDYVTRPIYPLPQNWVWPINMTSPALKVIFILRDCHSLCYRQGQRPTEV